ncbi:MAG: MBL fold metallo-hydrolase [Planctomycetota bacterium]|jgi:pyrroloquinoline quinone biosynthesis protein B
MRTLLMLCAIPLLAGCAHTSTLDSPAILVLGTSQDAGTPQAGAHHEPGWTSNEHRHMVASLALIDPESSKQWVFDATPDFPEQLYLLDATLQRHDLSLNLSGIFLTHAHIGHYTGLMHVGHESMGARGIPVYAMPRMTEFLSTNGPWDQLVRYENIELRALTDRNPARIGPSLSVTPFLVPHRDEYSETVGFRIQVGDSFVIFIPDIDSWEQLDAMGTRLEALVASAELVFIDATFYDDNEIPGRDMSQFPHPRVIDTMDRLQHLPDSERAKVHFIHMNHTNPAQHNSPERREILRRGFNLAKQGTLHTIAP